MADGVGPPKEERVVESQIDGLSVVASTEQIGEDRIRRCDGPEVLGPVQLPFGVLGVAIRTDADADEAMEADGGSARTEVVGEGVVAVQCRPPPTGRSSFAT